MAALAVACAGPLSQPAADLSANVPHRMTPAQVQQVVLEQIARDVDEIGRELVPAAVVSIELLTPGVMYETSTGAAFESPDASWAVVFRGTALLCTTTCSQFTGGTYIVDDRTGSVIGSALTGEVR